MTEIGRFLLKALQYRTVLYLFLYVVYLAPTLTHGSTPRGVSYPKCAASMTYSSESSRPNNVINWLDLPTTFFENPSFQPSHTIAILPIGSIEQHGPHLPLGTDTILTEQLIHHTLQNHLIPNVEVILILPTITYGASFEHSSFKGTVSIPDLALNGYLEALLKSGESAGLRKVVIVNGHGGQNANMELVIRKRRFDNTDAMLVGVDLQRMLTAAFTELGREVEKSDRKVEGSRKAENIDWEWEKRYGIHGGLIETSIMMHFKPNLVQKKKREKFDFNAEFSNQRGEKLFAEGIYFGWKAEDLNLDGVLGDARAASAELGEILVEKVGKRLASIFSQLGSR